MNFERKKKNGESYLIIKIEDEEEQKYIADGVQKVICTCIKEEYRSEFDELLNLIKRCEHNEKYDEENQLSTFIFAREAGQVIIESLLLCGLAGNLLAIQSETLNAQNELVKKQHETLKEQSELLNEQHEIIEKQKFVLKELCEIANIKKNNER